MKNLNIDQVCRMSDNEFNEIHEIQFKDVLLSSITKVINSDEGTKHTRLQNIIALGLLEKIISVNRRAIAVSVEGIKLKGKEKTQNKALLQNCFDCENIYKLELIQLITQL